MLQRYRDGDVNTVALDLPAEHAGQARRGCSSTTDIRRPFRRSRWRASSDAISVFDHESNAIPPRIEASDDGAELPQGCGHSLQQHR